MTPELTFYVDTATTTAAGALFAGLFAFTGAAILIPAISQRILPKPKETHLSDFLPFEGIARDGRTITLKNGSVARYFLVVGRDQSFIEQGEALSLARLRKEFLDGLAEINVTARIHTVRQPSFIRQATGFPNSVAEDVARRWNSQFGESFRTLNIICLSAKTQTRLDDGQQVIEASLNAYGVFPLSTDPSSNPEHYTLGEFLGWMTATASQPKPRATGVNLSDVLAADIIWFRPDGIIEFTNGKAKKYASIIGIKKIGDDMNSATAMELSALQMELSITRYVEPMSKAEALIKLEQHSRLAIASSFNPSVAAQFAAASGMIEAVDESRSAYCAYAQVITVFGNSIEEVERNETIVRNIVVMNGATAVRESGASQASWFMQFPTLDLLPRPYKLFTYNIAFDFVLDRPASGFPNSDWGPGPIASFKTASNTVYQHQFHISDAQAALGHGVVIAPTGSGKTVLMEFLSLMTSRHRDVKHFFFDRYRGTAIYNLAMGGKYLSLNAEGLPWSVQGGMNPFDCEDTDDNRGFLKLWLSTISNCSDHNDLDQISEAVDVSFEELDRSERSLAAIYQAAFAPGSRVKNELQKWVNPTQYGEIFNAPRDCIDLEDNWLTTFDMTKLLDDPTLGAATVNYLMHRIRSSMRRTNSPGFIFIDETEPLLKDPNFLNLFKVTLQEFRKVRGVVISVFQRPDALTASGVSQLVRQQSGTYYLFQNPGAKASDYREFELSEREMAFVLGQSSIARKAKRSILIKKPLTQESVIIDVDLGPLGAHLKLFSSTSKDVSLVSDLYKKFEGRWIERYIDDDAP